MTTPNPKESRNIRILGDCICIVAGICLVLAFAPYHLFWLAVICPLLLLLYWQNSTPRRAFTRGWLFGMGSFGFGVYWVYISIHEYGHAAVPLAISLTVLFAALLSLLTGLQGYLYQKLFPHNTTLKRVLVFPLLWLASEWLRGITLTGFPWLFLGYSQVASPLRGLLPIIGVWGMSFVLVLLAGLIATIFIGKQYKKIISGVMIIFILGIAVTTNTIEWTKKINNPITVSLIQGNIPQERKWIHEQMIDTMLKYYNHTIKHWESDLIVWPEGAIPIMKHHAKQYLDNIDKLAKKNNTSIIAGVPITEFNSRAASHYYNSMIVIGKGSGQYHKRHLVPFGEYIPWYAEPLKRAIKYFNIPMSDFSAGKRKQPLLTLNSTTLAPFICYEIAYAYLLIDYLPQANILLTISDDSWFGDSFAADQHLQIAQARALQTGRYMLFVSNTGITAIIKPNGQIQSRLPQFKSGVLTGKIYPMSGSTPWVRLADFVK